MAKYARFPDDVKSLQVAFWRAGVTSGSVSHPPRPRFLKSLMIWLERVTEKVTGNAQPGACVDVLPRCSDRGTGFSVLAAREMKREPPPPRLLAPFFARSLTLETARKRLLRRLGESLPLQQPDYNFCIPAPDLHYNAPSQGERTCFRIL